MRLALLLLTLTYLLIDGWRLTISTALACITP